MFDGVDQPARGGGQQAGFLVDDGVPQSRGGLVAHGGHPVLGRLDDSEPPAFLSGGHDVDAGALQDAVLELLADVAVEDHLAVHPQILGVTA